MIDECRGNMNKYENLFRKIFTNDLLLEKDDKRKMGQPFEK